VYLHYCRAQAIIVRFDPEQARVDNNWKVPVSFFDNPLWLYLFSLITIVLYLLMLIFEQKLKDVWSSKRAIAGMAVAAIGAASALAPMNITVQQAGSILGFVLLIQPLRQIWQRLTYEFFKHVALLGTEIGLTGGISTKLMILGGGLPHLCHILADVLLCTGVYSFTHLNNQKKKREHTDTV